MNDFAFYLAAHLAGDFLFQNDWMARNKSTSSFACFIHVLLYSACFMCLPWKATLAIALQHFLQDRFGLHLYWMKRVKQSPPEKWPVGPLCVDQAMHIIFLYLVYTYLKK